MFNFILFELPLPKNNELVFPNMLLDNTGWFSNLCIYWNYRDINDRKVLLKINYNGYRKWIGIKKFMEIKYVPYNKKFYAYQTKEVDPIPIDSKENNLGSIDLGKKRYITAYINNSKDFCLLYKSEHIFKEYLKISKKIAHYQTIAKKKNNKNCTHRIRRLYLKRKRKLNNYLNNILAHLSRKLKTYHISTIINGNLKGIRETPIPQHFHNKKQINKMIQNFWSYNLFLKKIQNKCEESRIDIILINEVYKSSICPICKIRVNPSDRSFLCSYCGYKQDRDVVGRINLLTKHIYEH